MRLLRMINRRNRKDGSQRYLRKSTDIGGIEWVCSGDSGWLGRPCRRYEAAVKAAVRLCCISTPIDYDRCNA